MEKTTVLYAYYRDLDFFCHRDPSTAAERKSVIHRQCTASSWFACIMGNVHRMLFLVRFLTISHLSALIPKRIALYCALACLLMVIATILPYDEGRVPMLSFLHTAAAMLGTGIYIACYWYCLFVYQSIDYWFYRMAMSCYNLLLLFCLLLIATFASINTLAEILFRSSCRFYNIVFFVCRNKRNTLNKIKSECRL